MSLSSRETALEILTFFDQNHHIPFKKLEVAIYTLEEEERPFCWSLIMDTLRKRIILDRLLNVFLKRPDNLPPPVMNVLRLGTLQLFFYDSVPDYAAVKTSVDLIKERRLKNLVNAVLRRIAGQKEDLGKILEQIGTTYPAWLSDHWREIEGFIPPGRLDGILSDSAPARVPF